MKKYWVFKILIIVLLMTALSIFYLKAFSKTGFVFLVVAGIIVAVLNFLNNKAYKKEADFCLNLSAYSVKDYWIFP
ncbi:MULTISPECIES: hypothetical protein [unclassified Peribacillus]|uniref:hypothetical protein n=1 Tax=unclassified Peribacillus TaxID=2675266 RepID=UPI0019127835|nr:MULTISPECIES: hypothetical protein [unclassified Peribacillus]MBK5463458.1 hypothetical protein [Peribacillus sp. TH27]